jgi:formate dehydrogenase major subunit
VVLAAGEQVGLSRFDDLLEVQSSPDVQVVRPAALDPTRKVYRRPENPIHPSPPEGRSAVFPFVFGLSRLTEHHTAGGMSRTLPYLAELQPAMFVEVSSMLAAERGLRHLDWAHVVTARAVVEARVLVTDRLRPLRVEGMVPDPNVLIQESKVGTCDIRPGRRPTGSAVVEYLAGYRRRAGLGQEEA